MRVLVVMNSVNVKLGGGIVQVILNYRNQLVNKGIDFEFALHAVDSKLVKELTQNNEKFYPLPNKKKNIIAYIRAFYIICKTGKYDIVHVHGNSATMGLELYIAQKAGIKNRIAHCHNSQCEHVLLNRILIPKFRTLYTVALACSEIAGEWLFGADKFQILHNAVDIDKFLFKEKIRNQYRKKLNISDNVLLLGHVGNINEQKNHKFLIEVFFELMKCIKTELILIGDGSLRKETEELTNTLGIAEKVHFLGVRGDVSDWMQAMDIFVFPSRWEGLGMAAIEAQVSGLFVVASTEVPKEACVTNKMFFLSLSDSKETWCNLLIQLSNQKNDREINRDLFQSYDINLEQERLLNIYEHSKENGLQL